MYQIVSGFAAGRTTSGMLCPILLLQFKTNDDKLEENQRRAPRMVRELKAMPEDNAVLQELNLFSFQGEHQETGILTVTDKIIARQVVETCLIVEVNSKY